MGPLIERPTGLGGRRKHRAGRKRRDFIRGQAPREGALHPAGPVQTDADIHRYAALHAQQIDR